MLDVLYNSITKNQDPSWRWQVINVKLKLGTMCYSKSEIIRYIDNYALFTNISREFTKKY